MKMEVRSYLNYIWRYFFVFCILYLVSSESFQMKLPKSFSSSSPTSFSSSSMIIGFHSWPIRILTLPSSSYMPTGFFLPPMPSFQRTALFQSKSDNPFSSSKFSPSSSPSPSSISSDLPEADEGFLSEIIFRNFQDIQFNERKKIGIIGTRNLSKNHQQMIELLSYALVLSGNHVITSGGGSVNSTNLAVIRGALRACNPDLLTVILPQSLSKQSMEIQQLLASVTNVIELPENDAIPLKDAANICNYQIFGLVEKIIVFAYHNSFTILNSVKDFEKAIETIKFYLD